MLFTNDCCSQMPRRSTWDCSALMHASYTQRRVSVIKLECMLHKYCMAGNKDGQKIWQISLQNPLFKNMITNDSNWEYYSNQKIKILWCDNYQIVKLNSIPVIQYTLLNIILLVTEAIIITTTCSLPFWLIKLMMAWGKYKSINLQS